MKTPVPLRAGAKAVAERPTANPEGKGLNGFLLDWYRTEPRGVVVKPERQVLAEFFTSMLILSAQFKYKPAIGVLNYLYFVDDKWSLSLIAPGEWSEQRREGFAGTCVLQADMTWTIAPSDQLGNDNAMTAAIHRFYEAFAQMLDSDLALADILPFHISGMPYYQRLHASALGRSLRATLTLGDQLSMKCSDWHALLPRRDTALLGLEDE